MNPHHDKRGRFASKIDWLRVAMWLVVALFGLGGWGLLVVIALDIFEVHKFSKIDAEKNFVEANTPIRDKDCQDIQAPISPITPNTDGCNERIDAAVLLIERGSPIDAIRMLREGE